MLGLDRPALPKTLKRKEYEDIFPTTFLGFDVTRRERCYQHIEWLEAEFDRLSKENRVLRIGLVDMDKELRQLRQQIAHTGVYRGEDGRIYSNKKKTS